MAILDTLTDILADLRSRLQEPTASLRTDGDLKLWLNLALREVAERTRYFNVSVSGSSVASTGSYSLTSGTFLITRHIDALGLKQVVYNGAEIDQAKERDLPVLRNSTSEGTPSQWFVYNGSIELFPIPSAVKTMKLYAWQYPAEMSAGANTSGLPISKNEIIIAGAMAIALEKDEHPDAPYYRRKYDRMVEEFVSLLEDGQNRHRREGIYLDPEYERTFRNR